MVGRPDRDGSEAVGESETGENSVDVFVGVDVGKAEHHAVALDASGRGAT